MLYLTESRNVYPLTYTTITRNMGVRVQFTSLGKFFETFRKRHN
jgi:hypothetical protein